MINVKNLNYEYGQSGRGIYDVNMNVEKGHVLGFLGPNGAGKTTAIRCLLGFMRGQDGIVTIDGMDAFKDSPKIAMTIGYIAGEPAFPEGMTGIEYLKFIIKLRLEHGSTLSKEELLKRMEMLAQYFELNTATKIKKMSKGMKQKTAIVSALLHDPAVYILDEPTSGLDPLMQSRFIDIMQNEKRRGKTMMISSHMFEEIERLADDIMIIKDGVIVQSGSLHEIRSSQRKAYIVRGVKPKDVIKLSDKLKEKQEGEELDGFEMKEVVCGELRFTFPASHIDAFVKLISKVKITEMYEQKITLEEVFLAHYANEGEILSDLDEITELTDRSGTGEEEQNQEISETGKTTTEVGND